MTKKYPTKKQLKALKANGWRRSAGGLAWQSPYDAYYYSPQAAVVRETIACERQSGDEVAEIGAGFGGWAARIDLRGRNE